MEYYIIVYKSTHDAMQADLELEKNSFEYRVMPTPTSITQSCGICTRLNCYEDIEKIISLNLVEYKNIYKKDKEGFELIR